MFLAPEVLDFRGGMWTPSIDDGIADPASGIVLARKAADDLGVGRGDTIVLRHPKALGGTTFVLVNDRIVVSGIHRIPLRVTAYLDSASRRASAWPAPRTH